MIIRAHDNVHFGVFAPAGAGKGTASVIPISRSYPAPVFVVDPKGENHELSADHRRKRFGHQTGRFDPFGVCGSVGDSLNPIDYLEAGSPGLLDNCRGMANMIVHRDGRETDPYWSNKTEQVIGTMIYYVAECETDIKRRNLLTVQAILQSPDAYLATLGIMKRHGGRLKQLADSLSWSQDKELNSIMSVAQSHTAWMDSPLVATCLSRSTVDPLGLKRGSLDLYAVLPPDRLVTHAPLLRLWLGTTIRLLIDGMASERNPVLFLVDEAAHIGKMQVLEDAITLMRGYGIRIGLYFQSLNQLQACYGSNAQTVLDNLGTQIYFGISNSFESAEAVSRRIGDCTITQVSVNDTKGYSTGSGQSGAGGSHSSSLSVTTSEMARRVARTEEIMTAAADQAFVFHRNMPVIIAKLCKYYASPAFRRGRTGDDSRLGFAAGAMAAILLVASLLLSIIVASLPMPATPRHSTLSAPTVTGPGDARPAPSRQPAAVKPLPPRRRTNDRLPSRSGYLIPIR